MGLQWYLRPIASPRCRRCHRFSFSQNIKCSRNCWYRYSSAKTNFCPGFPLEHVAPVCTSHLGAPRTSSYNRSVMSRLEATANKIAPKSYSKETLHLDTPYNSCCIHQQKDFCIYNPGIAQVDLHRYFGFRGPFSWIILLYS